MDFSWCQIQNTVVRQKLGHVFTPKTRTSAKIWPTLFLIEFFECEFLAWKLSNKVKLGKVNYPKSKLYSTICTPLFFENASTTTRIGEKELETDQKLAKWCSSLRFKGVSVDSV